MAAIDEGVPVPVLVCRAVRAVRVARRGATSPTRCCRPCVTRSAATWRSRPTNKPMVCSGLIVLRITERRRRASGVPRVERRAFLGGLRRGSSSCISSRPWVDADWGRPRRRGGPAGTRRARRSRARAEGRRQPTLLGLACAASPAQKSSKLPLVLVCCLAGTGIGATCLEPLLAHGVISSTDAGSVRDMKLETPVSNLACRLRAAARSWVSWEGLGDIVRGVSATGILRIEIDGAAPTVEALQRLALAPEGHFTAAQVRGRCVRGLELHLARLDAASRELFGTGLDGDRVCELVVHALAADFVDASLRVIVFAADVADGASVLVTLRPPAGAAATRRDFARSATSGHCLTSSTSAASTGRITSGRPSATASTACC